MKIAVALTDFYNKQSDYFELDYREGTVQDIINNTKLGISVIGILYISPNQEETFAHILSHSDAVVKHQKAKILCFLQTSVTFVTHNLTFMLVKCGCKKWSMKL